MQEQQQQDIAIPFIIYDQKKGFKLNPEAGDFLKNLKSKKLGIMSVVGKYRTGKSFFVNRVLLNRQGGFNVGPTINPCTKGLWLWKKVIPRDDMDIILIDTEGFGGMDEDINHDSRIFLLTLLMSTYFIYNSVGNIDENAINNISTICNLAKEMTNDIEYFPSFLWVVRDFALQIVDGQGNSITQKEYLERALEYQDDKRGDNSKNQSRKFIKSFFQDRDCVTLVRPVESEKDLQNLNQLENSQLRPKFLEQIQSLQKKIFKSIKPKAIGGKNINGEMLVDICQSYIETINKGDVPNIQNAWQYVSNAQNLKVLNQCVNMINFEEKGLGLSDAKCEEIKVIHSEKILTFFKKNVLDENFTEYQVKMNQKLEEKFVLYKQKNLESLETIFENFSRPYVQQIKVNFESYNKLDDFKEEFMNLLKDLKTQFPGYNYDYLSRLEDQLTKQATDHISCKKQREADILQKKTAFQLQNIEQDFTKKKQEWGEEREKLKERLQTLEIEKMQLISSEEFKDQKNKYSTEEREKFKKQCEQLKLIQKQLENELKEYKSTDYILEEQKKIKVELNFDKQICLLQQENQYLKSENEQLRNLEMRQKLEINNLIVENNNLKISKIQLQDNSHTLEQEEQINYLKKQLQHKKDENCGMIETNRHLSGALEKIEIRCKMAEAKAEEYKIYKKMIKNSTQVQCTNCANFIQSSIFEQHMNQCLETSYKVSQFIGIDLNQLQIQVQKVNENYILEVTFNDNRWRLVKNENSLRFLHQHLFYAFQQSEYAQKSQNFPDLFTLSDYDQNILLQQYFDDITQIDTIRNSRALKTFIGFDQYCEINNRTNRVENRVEGRSMMDMTNEKMQQTLVKEYEKQSPILQKNNKKSVSKEYLKQSPIKQKNSTKQSRSPLDNLKKTKKTFFNFENNRSLISQASDPKIFRKSYK